MIEFAIGKRDVGTARGLARALGESLPPSVGDRLRALERELAEREAEGARLRALEADHDLSVGAAERRVLVRLAAIGISAVLVVLSTLFATGIFVPTPRSVTIISAIGISLASVVVLRYRAQLLRNRMSRQISFSVVLVVGVVVIHRLVGVLRGLPIADLAAEDGFILAVAAALSALTIRRLLFVPALLFTIAAVSAPFLGSAGFVPVLAAGAISILLLLSSPSALAAPALGAVGPQSQPGGERER